MDKFQRIELLIKKEEADKKKIAHLLEITKSFLDSAENVEISILEANVRNARRAINEAIKTMGGVIDDKHF